MHGDVNVNVIVNVNLNALYALVRREHKRFQMLSEFLCQQQNRARSPAKNSTPTDQPQRKPVGRWCLAGNVERLEVVGCRGAGQELDFLGSGVEFSGGQCCTSFYV